VGIVIVLRNVKRILIIKIGNVEPMEIIALNVIVQVTFKGGIYEKCYKLIVCSYDGSVFDG
jgi:hypothetical protein